jgi:predicted dehydrogenase
VDLSLNVGIVGCGAVSAVYLKTFALLEAVKLVAVADIDFSARAPRSLRCRCADAGPPSTCPTSDACPACRNPR